MASTKSLIFANEKVYSNDQRKFSMFWERGKPARYNYATVRYLLSEPMNDKVKGIMAVCDIQFARRAYQNFYVLL